METNWCILEIDEKCMWARIALKLPEGDEVAPITAAHIEKLVRDQGISSGINCDAITALAESVTYGQFVEVARGKEAVNGTDGHFEFLIPVEDARSKPVVNEDGSVDYYNSLKLAEVKADEQFARYVHATQGEYGHNIYSKIVAPIPGKEIPPLKGSGFYTSSDKEEYFSKYSGHITRKDNTVTIEKVYIIKGDLDLDTGNINFEGDVEVRGDVRSGLSIQSGGSVFIHGHVGACYIQASQNVTIQKGIQGRNRCNIIAGGDVICKFVERCAISAGGTVFADSILDSIVTARNEVRVISKSGIIIGGTIIGMMGITAKEVGNDTETITLLQTGPSKEDLARSSLLTEQLFKLKNDYELLEKQLKKYDAVKNPAKAGEIANLRQKVLRVKVMVATDRNKTSDELSRLNEEINNARKNACVHITGISHPGIKISIENNFYIVTEPFKDVIYKLQFGKVEAIGADDNTNSSS